MRLVCVQPSQIAQAWTLVQPLITEAMRRGGMGDAGPVYADIVAGRSLLWLAWGGEIRAAAVTELTAAQGRKICTIVACSGDDMNEWLHLIGGLEEHARAEGCAAMRIIGREGWQRALPDYRRRAVVLEKDLT